jgi:hypothetical protein
MRAISFILAPLIRSRAASAIKLNLETLLPGLIQNVFAETVEVPYIGTFKTQFMRGPSIAPDGMLADLRLVPV